jgi:hypothetical protein
MYKNKQLNKRIAEISGFEYRDSLINMSILSKK